ncbi:MAG: 5'-nucleotidase C-terminal domain-containing protein, partial [Treponema sp.]|nr:5'-nucleotidase C-terminal domain-containing protein [Treponema sp.]
MMFRKTQTSMALFCGMALITAAFILAGCDQATNPDNDPPATNPDWDAIDWSDTTAVIGTAAAGLTGSSTDKRAREMATGNLATDALVWYIENKIEDPYKQNIDFAYTNGGGLQNNGLAAGPITVANATGDVVKDDKLKVFSVTGAQIKALLIKNARDMTQVSKEVKYTINIPESGSATIT